MTLISFTPGTTIRAADFNSNFTAILDGTGGFNFDKVRVTKSANQTISNDTETDLTWNQEDFDTNTMHDNVTNNERLVSKFTSKYFLSCNITFDNNASGIRNMIIINSAGTVIASAGTTAQTNDDQQLSCSGIYSIAANDYAKVRVYQNRGGTLDVLAARGSFSMTMLP